jgi:segregation and condensation protein B
MISWQRLGVTMTPDTYLEAQLEALLIVADQPVAAVELATATERPVKDVKQALKSLRERYDGEHDDGQPRAGFELREIGSGYRFYAREEHDDLISRFVDERTVTKLSQAAYETLTVIAYRQPITRGAIASIRAVNVDSVVRTLVTRGLVSDVGHDEETGAIQYGTTDALLEHLGITSLDELPPISPLLEDGTEGFDYDELQ